MATVFGIPRVLAQSDVRPRLMVTTSVVALAAIIMIDLVDGQIGEVFGVGYVLIAATAPVAVQMRGLYLTASLPVVLLVTSLFLLSVFAPDSVKVDGTPATAGVFARTLASLIDHGVQLLVAQALVVVAILLRLATAPRH